MFKLSKIASVIDYPKSGLDESIWILEGVPKPVLKENLKKQILDKLEHYFIDAGFKHKDKWIKKIKLIGSLTSYQWRDDSDLDVHTEVDVKKFIDSEFDGAIEPEDAKKLLDETARQKLNIEAPDKLAGTQHPIEYYFEMHTKGKLMEGQSIIEYDGVYELLKNKWLKPPREVSSAFDPAEIYSNIFTSTEELARKFDIHLGTIERKLQDVKYLNEALGTFKDKNTIETYKKAIQDSIVKIEKEIKDYMIKMKKVIDERKKSTSQYDDANLRMKFLNKYSYIFILKQLEKVLGTSPVVTEDKLDKIEDAISKKDRLTRTKLFRISKLDS